MKEKKASYRIFQLIVESKKRLDKLDIEIKRAMRDCSEPVDVSQLEVDYEDRKEISVVIQALIAAKRTLEMNEHHNTDVIE